MTGCDCYTVTQQRDMLRAVLEGAEYRDIDSMLENGTVFACRHVGAMAKSRTIEVIEQRDSLQRELATARSDVLHWHGLAIERQARIDQLEKHTGVPFRARGRDGQRPLIPSMRSCVYVALLCILLTGIAGIVAAFVAGAIK